MANKRRECSNSFVEIAKSLGTSPQVAEGVFYKAMRQVRRKLLAIQPASDWMEYLDSKCYRAAPCDTDQYPELWTWRISFGMMRPAIRPIVVAAIASGIGMMALDDGVEEPERSLYQNVIDASDRLVEQWPTKMRVKEYEAAKCHLTRFLEIVRWEQKRRSIYTYAVFLMYLLENVRDKIREPTRLSLVDNLITAVMRCYEHYIEKYREYDLCVSAGIRAGQIFQRLLEE